ncbi:Sec7 domain-containing protein [Plectosphaerella plurivora]|uniref:Sec7 domain-containing protein n=1 Tax=Plectosphaerella plurivora TaxID=936078 RepID=A0A9P8VAB9_9PEZI|nr:Sec7 domain-containing protein [Plectosphaerella plurivora]
MASTESASQRRRRRPDLNIDTTPPTTSHKTATATAAPSTPPPPSKSKPPSVSQHSSQTAKQLQPSEGGANHKSSAAAAGRALAVPSSTHNAQDSFLDAATPVDADMSNKERDLPLSPRTRDSHDLSLPARQVTRDSLMTNMLMSLDQFSMTASVSGAPFGSASRSNAFDDSSSTQAAYPNDIEGGGDSLARAIARQDRRANGHTHGYSYSSDYDPTDDSSRYSSQPSRGRRSNSSSNFQTNLGRINSMRESLHSNSGGGASRHLHSRGGKGSKSSSTNSIDAGYVQVLGSQRWAHGFGGRSSSFDHGSTRPNLPHSNSHPSNVGGGWHIDFGNNTFLDDYDAAPTPTIPGGPRRIPPMTAPAPVAPVIPLPPPEPEYREPVIDHKRSSRSLKTPMTTRRTETKQQHMLPPKETTPQKAAASAAASAPQPDTDSAPAPHVGYGKTKEQPVHAAPAPTQAASQPKERPGFFRRVFGGGLSRNSSPSNNSATDSRNPSIAASANAAVDPDDRASQAKSQSTPPSRDTSSSHSHHNVLQKKPSSFFRRRKKSIAEDVPPLPPVSNEHHPLPPPAVAQFQIPPGLDKLNVKAEPSPVSSLRKVMSPYLRSNTSGPATPQRSPGHLQTETPIKPATPTQPTDQDEAREYKRSFSPDYEPSPNAKIREVEPEKKDKEDEDMEGENRMATPTRPPPEVPRSSGKKNDCFLNLDGSDDNDADAEAVAAKSAKTTSRTPSKDPLAQRSLAVPSTSREASTERPTPAEEEVQDDLEVDPKRQTLILPIEGTKADSIMSQSTGTDYKSAVQTPSVMVEDSSHVMGPFDSVTGKPLDEPEFVVGDPTDDDRQKAQRIYDGNEDFIQKEKAASWMGEEGLVRQRTLRAYMELYDFTNKNVAYSLRQVCERLVLRAETQQVDRILVAFSKRWCDCNPNHGFKASDVIHTICYSIMLLNTDLHMADIEQKMTRSQFVKNVMTTIQQALAESAPDAFNKRASILPDKNGLLSGEDMRPSVDERSNRFSLRPPARREQSADHSDGPYADDCGPLVKTPFDGSMRAWEAQIEVVLKDIYSSIRDERLPLFGAEPSRSLGPTPQSSLSVMGMLKRTPSVLSKAPSEAQSSIRGRGNDTTRPGPGNRFVSKSRSRPRLNNGFSSSRTSFDDGNSIWSPATSSAAWSRYSLGRTQTSMSMDSFGKPIAGGDFQQSIGFANALSQAITRDDASALGAPSMMSDEGPAALLDDESLELAGPPWVKEGICTHKHHLDGVEKKAKDRNWHEVFAVVEKGQMSLFSFAANKSLGRKSKAARNAKKGPVLVGGGNWQDNATNLGTFSLRQTLASALPSPGYSRARPHVWALSLPTGAVHLFQVGTPEIIKEFVTTANYWSARLSTHPLVGGISNIEYGWSEACINNALVSAINESTAATNTGTPNSRASRPNSSAAPNHPPPTAQGRSSMQSNRSFRSASFDYALGSTGAYAGMAARGKLPGDRIHISEWSPPTQSMRPSSMPEHEQLATLTAYVKGIEDELQAHNALRSPMLLAFTPRGANANKAMANWERKSAYLLREIVKFRTYVDCLQQAETRREEIYAERDLARRAARGELSDDEGDTPVVEADPDVTIKA